MSEKVIFIALFLISLVNSIAVAAAQDSVPQLIALSANELNFYGEEGTTQLSRTLTIVGLAEEEVQVTLFPAELYDNSSGKNVSIVAIESFSVRKNEEKIANILLNTSRASAGTYQGAIIVTATTPENITTTTITVTAKIEIEKPLLSVSQLIVIVLFIIPMFFGLYWKDEWDKKWFVPKKRLVVVFLGIFVAAVFIGAMVTSIFGDLTILSSALIAPFIAYVISYVKDKRTERLEKEKASRKIRNTGIEKDIELIRNVMGETATHCASFRPNLYEENTTPQEENNIPHGENEKLPGSEYDAFHRILYNESGLLSKKVWEKSRRQGMISDLPMLELEKYYDYIDLYNRYYSCAIKLTKVKKPSKISPNKFDFERFEKFREQYAELEKVIFVYLSYILGLLSKTYLSPLKVEYRRVTRTLMKKLIDYEILDPNNHKHGIEKFKVKYEKEPFFVKFVEKKLNEFKKKEAELKEQSKEQSKGEVEKWDNNELEKKFKKWKIKKFDEWMFKETLKKRIEKWDLSAVELEQIVKEIYNRISIPTFFRKVADDFQHTYKKLKNCIKELPPLPRDCVEEEKNEKQIVVKGSLTLDVDIQEKQNPKNT